MELDPIGRIYTPFEDRGAIPRQGGLVPAPGDGSADTEAAEGEVVLDPPYASGLAGVAPGDRLDLVWWADRADTDRLRVEKGGVFGTRSPDRPVPICVTPVEVIAVGERRLRVRGVDMLDGTPLLDVKASLDR